MSLHDSSPSDSLSTTNQAPSASTRLNWQKYAAPLALLCLTYYWLYRNGLAWLAEVWSHNDYSHGFLVPLVSCYIVWEQRERYHPLPVAPVYPAAAIIFLFSLALLLISRSSAFIQIEIASLFLIIPGILLFLFGWQITRAAFLPWLYLSFALPWFDLFLGRVYPLFQRLSAFLGAKLLSLVYPVFLHDTHIQLPSINMEVIAGCSGVHFFISVLAIGIPLVYLTQRSWSRSLLVLGLGLLITMLANGFRIALAGIMGENFGPEMLHGPAHILHGWFVAWFGWAGLFLVNWIAIKKTATSLPRLFERWKLQPVVNSKQDRIIKFSPKPFFLLSAILACCTIITYLLSPHSAPLPAPLSTLPTKIAAWEGNETTWVDQKNSFPKADDHLERVYYSSQASSPVYLYIAYFNQQTEYKRLIQQLSLPLHKKTVTVTFPSSESGLFPHKINSTTLMQNGISYDVYFWYQFPGGKTVTGQNEARLAAMQNGILHRHNNGAIVLVATTRSADKNSSSISAFLKTFNPVISELLP